MSIYTVFCRKEATYVISSCNGAIVQSEQRPKRIISRIMNVYTSQIEPKYLCFSHNLEQFGTVGVTNTLLYFLTQQTIELAPPLML